MMQGSESRIISPNGGDFDDDERSRIWLPDDRILPVDALPEGLRQFRRELLAVARNDMEAMDGLPRVPEGRRVIPPQKQEVVFSREALVRLAVEHYKREKERDPQQKVGYALVGISACGKGSDAEAIEQGIEDQGGNIQIFGGDLFLGVPRDMKEMRKAIAKYPEIFDRVFQSQPEIARLGLAVMRADGVPVTFASKRMYHRSDGGRVGPGVVKIEPNLDGFILEGGLKMLDIAEYIEAITGIRMLKILVMIKPEEAMARGILRDGKVTGRNPEETRAFRVAEYLVQVPEALEAGKKADVIHYN